ncbi:hypothetical protein [Longimicrobium sp.]|uniref:hypothetical protein n=1 Tax=Longimicrobium sp. TaxID=2029185 RepID=UPI002E301D0A|nr:hypothetical protein [Longimicrobium sp.]HEX6036907.1 hypothetical protein [Longimicrobium sp.]
MSLNLDDLIVESFVSMEETQQYSDSVIIRTVLYETEQLSCGGTCRTCDCWA